MPRRGTTLRRPALCSHHTPAQVRGVRQAHLHQLLRRRRCHRRRHTPAAARRLQREDGPAPAQRPPPPPVVPDRAQAARRGLDGAAGLGRSHSAAAGGGVADRPGSARGRAAAVAEHQPAAPGEVSSAAALLFTQVSCERKQQSVKSSIQPCKQSKAKQASLPPSSEEI